jgi:hypothetical protein
MSLGSLFKKVFDIQVVNTKTKESTNMGTLAPTGPKVTYTAEQQEQMLKDLFSPPTGVSPVPAEYATAKAELTKIELGVANAKLAAINAWLGVLGANTAILTNPQSVTADVWAKLNTVTTTLNACGPTQNDITNYSAALDSWNASNSGSLTPSALPAIPASLTQYK